MRTTKLRTLCVAAALPMATALMAAGSGVSGPGVANAPAPAALRALEPGEWELRGRGEGAETQKLCVTDLRQLLQVRHGRALCPSFTVSDSPNAVSVTYDCAAAGTGRTDLRIETARLVQIRSQGVADGAPFAFAAEGRRIGVCG
ncbi:DUF3617 domain-containing protein [Sphingobium rhizovicinum]|uniref:DUF3617 domain-containing protein n=1 Tax=Sphingobium rhizovicinum TaxID=432308 RepID=A0ABV7NHI2_9SPHN